MAFGGGDGGAGAEGAAGEVACVVVGVAWRREDAQGGRDAVLEGAAAGFTGADAGVVVPEETGVLFWVEG